MKRGVRLGPVVLLLAALLPACSTKKNELILDPDADVQATNQTTVTVTVDDDEVLKHEYAAIYGVIRAGDAALDAGSLNAARDFYTQALQRLMLLRQTHPQWNTDILDFRIDYCRERLRAIAARAR